MLFVRRQFEMHKRNSHIIRGTLNSTVTRVPSPFPHPVTSVYLFLSLSPSFCLSVCPYFPLSVDHLSGQPRNFGHFGVRLHSNWKHMSNGWLISSFNLHSPTSLLPLTHTHTLCVWEALSKNADRRSSHPAVRTKKVVRVTIQTLFSSCRTEIPF